MPSVWVTEAAGIMITSGGHEVQALIMPPLAEYKVDFGATGPAFNAGTTAIRIVADANCWASFDGNAPVADTSTRINQEKEEVFGIGPGATNLRPITRT